MGLGVWGGVSYERILLSELMDGQLAGYGRTRRKRATLPIKHQGRGRRIFRVLHCCLFLAGYLLLVDTVRGCDWVMRLVPGMWYSRTYHKLHFPQQPSSKSNNNSNNNKKKAGARTCPHRPCTLPFHVSYGFQPPCSFPLPLRLLSLLNVRNENERGNGRKEGANYDDQKSVNRTWHGQNLVLALPPLSDNASHSRWVHATELVKWRKSGGGGCCHR